MSKPTVQKLHKELYIFGEHSLIALIYKFNKTKQQWEFASFKCAKCEQTLKYASNAIKHTDNCRNINTTKKEKEMPIQVVTIKGERYYRWGDSGKPYKNRADAEKQAAAAYASGYKEPMKAVPKK